MAAGDTNLTMIGNLVSDPELRFTPSEAARAASSSSNRGNTFYIENTFQRVMARDAARAATRV